MGIYRGAGGSGDAVNDASSEALITIQARDAAIAAQAAAEAAQAAAELAETNAETAETNAETAETNAETAEANAETAQAAAEAAQTAAEAAQTAAELAETNAETAETNAAASASAASTSASNAASSASAASTSATNAANSATSAANSATAAQAAQVAAEAALDQFDDTYLGAKSSNPTVDNDGNALTTGDQYFNTVANELRIWNGSSWQAASTVGGTVTSLTVTGAFAANGSTTIGDASGDALTINSSAVSIPNGLNFDSNTLVIDAANNRVGIGTASPTVPLDVTGAIKSSSLTSGRVVYSTTGGQLTDSSNLTYTSAALQLGASISGSYNTYQQIYSATNGTANSYVGNWVDDLILSTNRAFSQGAGGWFVNDSAKGTAQLAIGSEGFKFATLAGSSAGSPTERMRITSTGNVGIGTASPSAKLEVSSTARLGFFDINVSTANAAVWINGSDFGLGTFYGNSLKFLTANTERMRIDSSGNLLVGGTSSIYTSSGRGIVEINGSSEAWLGLEIGGAAASYIRAVGNDLNLVNTKAGDARFWTDNTERMRIASNGALGIGGANYGTSGQVLTSNGSGSAPSWQTVSSGGFDAGTRMIFAQTSAPTGWTKDITNYNNHALRVVTGTASTGGTVDFTTAFASQAVSGTVGTSGATTLSTSQIPSHNHSSAVTGNNSNGGGEFADFNSNSGNTGSTGGGGSHTHSGGTFTGNAINLAVKYLDVITATKN